MISLKRMQNLAPEKLVAYLEKHGACPYYPQKSQGHTPVNFARRKADSSTAYNYAGESVNKAGATDRYPTSVLVFDCIDNNAPGRFHVNQKPTKLLQHLIRSYTRPGDRVLDFTAGSFSTGEACALEGRDFTGIEISADFCAIGEARIKRILGQPADLPKEIDTAKVLPLFG